METLEHAQAIQANSLPDLLATMHRQGYTHALAGNDWHAIDSILEGVRFAWLHDAVSCCGSTRADWIVEPVEHFDRIRLHPTGPGSSRYETVSLCRDVYLCALDLL